MIAPANHSVARVIAPSVRADLPWRACLHAPRVEGISWTPSTPAAVFPAAPCGAKVRRLEGEGILARPSTKGRPRADTPRCAGSNERPGRGRRSLVVVRVISHAITQAPRKHAHPRHSRPPRKPRLPQIRSRRRRHRRLRPCRLAGRLLRSAGRQRPRSRPTPAHRRNHTRPSRSTSPKPPTPSSKTANSNSTSGPTPGSAKRCWTRPERK